MLSINTVPLVKPCAFVSSCPKTRSQRGKCLDDEIRKRGLKVVGRTRGAEGFLFLGFKLCFLLEKVSF